MLKLDVNLPLFTYPIYIKNGLIDSFSELLCQHTKTKKVVVITDENVYQLYGEPLITELKRQNFDSETIILSPGEQSKSLETLQSIYEKLTAMNITKSDLIIAFGGGVIGDITGFAAATYLRGVPFVQIPTSLTAQVDSSIGGKVAVNLPQGKNLVGAFYQPACVLIDTQFLTSLSPYYFSDGMAEVIKYGCIEDKDLFDLLNSHDINTITEYMDKIVYRCCEIKKNIVEVDEKDDGLRMILNFGHTIGHGVENYFGYGKYSHGQGVAIGMADITKNSEAMGLTLPHTYDAIKDVLEKYELPSELPVMDKALILNAVMKDKKSRGNQINIILLNEIGKSYIHKINKDEFSSFI